MQSALEDHEALYGLCMTLAALLQNVNLFAQNIVPIDSPYSITRSCYDLGLGMKHSNSFWTTGACAGLGHIQMLGVSEEM